MDVGRKRVIEAGRLYQGARDAFGAHRQSCYSCHAAERDHTPKRLCDVGWELAKAATSTYIALERARGNTPVRDRGEQMELF